MATSNPQAGGDRSGSQKQPDRLRVRVFGYRVAIAAALVVGVALSSLGFYILLQHDRKLTRQAFGEAANANVAALRIAIGRVYESVEASGALFDAYGEVTREAFEIFGERALSRNPALKAVSWAPRVPAAALGAFERSAQRDIPGYQVREFDKDRSMVPAARRDVYFPIRHSVDRSGVNPYGLDQSGDPMRRVLYPEIIASGRLGATSPVPLLTGEDKGVTGVVLYRPVYRSGVLSSTPEQRERNFIGFSTSVIVMHRQVNGVLNDAGVNSVRVVLYDPAAPEANRLLAAWPDAGPGRGEAETDGLRQTEALDIGGRHWQAVLTPMPDHFSLAPTWRPWAVLATGLILSLLLAAFIESMRRHALVVERMAVSDLLTGLYNRRFLEEFLNREILRAQRNLLPVAALMIDIDFFKRVNDTFGHQAGDVVLAALGALLRSRIRGSDIACRYGGEEFLVVMPDSSEDTARLRAEELRLAVNNLDFIHAGRHLDPVTVSIGVAGYPGSAHNAEELVRHADAALYKAKRSGRNRTVVFQPDDPAETGEQAA